MGGPGLGHDPELGHLRVWGGGGQGAAHGRAGRLGVGGRGLYLSAPDGDRVLEDRPEHHGLAAPRGQRPRVAVEAREASGKVDARFTEAPGRDGGGLEPISRCPVAPPPPRGTASLTARADTFFRPDRQPSVVRILILGTGLQVRGARAGVLKGGNTEGGVG